MSSVASFAAVMERTNSRGTTVVNQDREEIAGMSCKEKNRERERGERETGEREREKKREKLITGSTSSCHLKLIRGWKSPRVRFSQGAGFTL